MTHESVIVIEDSEPIGLAEFSIEVEIPSALYRNLKDLATLLGESLDTHTRKLLESGMDKIGGTVVEIFERGVCDALATDTDLRQRFTKLRDLT